MTDRSDQSVEAPRRGVLASIGVLAGMRTSAMARGQQTAEGAFAAVQGDQCVPVAPLSGSEPVEAFYDYRLPERFVSEENGARDGGQPYFSSAGTRHLQGADTSLLFLYEGPDGTSLVVVHGEAAAGSSGGSVTFRVEGLPSDGRWVVKDDLYRDPNTGEIAASNFDRWSLGGPVHTIDWTWGANTDGGAFRGLDAETSVTIHPAFNEAATLFGEHYDGRVAEWHLLAADGSGGVRRVALDMTVPVTIRAGDCSAGEDVPLSGDDRSEQRRRREKHEKKQRKHRRKHQKKQRKHRKKHERKQRKHRKKHQKKQRKHRKKHEKKQQKHRRERRKHEKKEQKKHEKQQEKHEKQRKKHEKKQRKHERQQRKHERQRKKHERQQKKHERQQKNHERQRKKHERQKRKHEKQREKHGK